MFSVNCAANGGAAAAVHHGFTTFDFDQLVHPAYGLVGVGAANAPTGCCTALTIAWLHNWRANGNGTYAAWVNVGGGGHHGVLQHTVAIFQGGVNWAQPAGVTMNGYGFVSNGALVAGPAWGNAALLSAAVMANRYTILVAGGANGSHAVGVFRVGAAVYFFDPNEGEMHFRSGLDFANWFYGGYAVTCLLPGIGIGPNLWLLRYN